MKTKLSWLVQLPVPAAKQFGSVVAPTYMTCVIQMTPSPLDPVLACTLPLKEGICRFKPVPMRCANCW